MSVVFTNTEVELVLFFPHVARHFRITHAIKILLMSR